MREIDELLEDHPGYQDAELVAVIAKRQGRCEPPVQAIHRQKRHADATERCIASSVTAHIVHSLETCEVEHERAVGEPIES